MYDLKILDIETSTICSTVVFHRIILSSRYLEQDVDLSSGLRSGFVLRVSLFSYLEILQSFEGLFVSEFYSRTLVCFTNLKKRERNIF